MEKKLQKLYLKDSCLLAAQDLWQAHYQILLIIILKEFIKSSVQTVVSNALNAHILKMVMLQ